MAVADGVDRPGGLLGTKQTLCGNVVTLFMVTVRLIWMADDVERGGYTSVDAW